MTEVYDHEFKYSENSVPLEVELALPDARGSAAGLNYSMTITQSFARIIPFEDVLNWLHQIATGAMAATWLINEEGSVSRLQFYSSESDMEDDADFLHVQTGETLDRVHGAKVARWQFIDAFYNVFLALAEDPTYKSLEWDQNQ